MSELAAPKSPSGPRPLRGPKTPKSRYAAQRHYDQYWTWPKTLSFLSSEEVQMLPKDIQDIVKTYLVDNTIWSV